jgi:hypothetical protein
MIDADAAAEGWLGASGAQELLYYTVVAYQGIIQSEWRSKVLSSPRGGGRVK